jgi:CBS domain-containing protein
MSDRPVLPDLEPYRRRVSEIMRRPAPTVSVDADLPNVARHMTNGGSGVLFAVDRFDQPVGILTERDVIAALAAHGVDALALTAADIMTRDIVGISETAFVFRAIGRMRRLNLRHLAVTDDAGRYTGTLSARRLLHLRAQSGAVIADELDVAKSAADLAHARAALPQLAETLLQEQVGARDIAAVISGIYSDITARAAAIVEAEFVAAGAPPPAPWCVLVLGSGGRGESLLKPDQDNAIIHAGSTEDDGWYARAGERMNDLLDGAGIPYCKGGVMAKNTGWRGNQGQWRARVTDWIRRQSPAALLNVDIFYDLKPVYGALRLGEALRREALAAARGAPDFLRLLAEQTAQLHPAIGFLGRLKTDRDNRIDLKLGGLLPLVSAARLMALRLGEPATATADRLQAVAAAGRINEADLAGLLDAQALLLRCVLQQQIADLAAGRDPGSHVDVTRLPGRDRDRLKAALNHLDLLPDMVQTALTA